MLQVKLCLYKQKFNNGNSEHYTRMKYLHLDIFFGLHTIDLVLSFLGFSTATSSTDNFLWVESSICPCSICQFLRSQHKILKYQDVRWHLAHNRPSND